LYLHFEQSKFNVDIPKLVEKYKNRLKIFTWCKTYDYFRNRYN